MNKMFYARLAATNIRKNAKTYFPYILTCIGTAAMFYIICSLFHNSGLEYVMGSETVTYILGLGTYVTGIFAVIFLFYTNSFLIKRRKKEFGLYNILGMEKRHLSRVVLWETIYIAVISLLLGIILGIALDKLMYMAILRMFDCDIPLGFEFSSEAFYKTCALFGAIFILIFLNSLRQIHLSKPIELLKGGQVGEKEPRTKVITAILGVLCLCSGYYISITTENPITAMLLFFVAVVLVIFGTYFLFTSGSIALLKLLRKNKRYYYKTNHFISVSGMLYRMKQNAVGLANICVLSTAVLVMVSTTLSLYMGMNDIMMTRYPRSILVSTKNYSQEYVDDIHAQINTVLQGENLTPQNQVEYAYLDFAAVEEDDFFNTDYGNSSTLAMDHIRNLIFLTLADYNRMEGEQHSLAQDEVLIYSNRSQYAPDTLKVFDAEFKIKERLENFTGKGRMEANITDSHFIVVKDISIIEKLDFQQKEVYGENSSDIKFYYGFDLDIDSDNVIRIYHNIQKHLSANAFEGFLECRQDSRISFLSLYGGLFFIGVFLGVLFMMATILIIYYKQISEGYDDKERFEIMQKVGISRSEIKKSIRSQVLTVFFLPLMTAGIHVGFAFPVIRRILALISLNNVSLFLICVIGCFLAFAVLYALLYILTSKIYYKIVS